MSDTDSVNSFLSWTSQLTTCVPIEKALEKFDGKTKFQRNVIEIVTALKNAIIKNGGTDTTTEFFAAMITFLKGTDLEVDNMEACVFILKHLMQQHLPIAVLRHTTADVSKIVLNLFSGAFGKNEAIVKTALFCMSKIISIQTDENCNLDNIKHLYRTLFSFTTDSRKTINEKACKAILYIFSAKTKANAKLSRKHPLIKETTSILTNSIKSQNVTNKKRDNMDMKIKPSPEDDRLSFSLTMLSALLKSKLFNSDCVVVYLETLIQCLLSLQIVPIQCQILNILSELFVKKVLSPEQIARSITSLFAYLNLCSGKTNSKSNTSPIPPSFIGTLWLNTVLMGFESLILNEQKTFVESTTNQIMDCRIIALSHGTNLIKFSSDWLLSDCDDLKKVASNVLNKLCSGALVTSEFKDNYFDTEQFNDVDNWLTKWADILCKLLLVYNTELWIQVLDNLIHLLVRSGGKCTDKLINLVFQFVPQLAELRDSYEDTDEEVIASLMKDKLRNVKSTLTVGEKTLKNSIEGLIGTIIKLYGFNQLVKVMPLADIMGDTEGGSKMELLSTRTWIVPLIKLYTENTSLDQFRCLIMPCIQMVTQKIDNLTNNLTESMDVDNTSNEGASSVAIATLGTLRYQLWSCLPSFAKNVIAGGIQQVSDNIIESHQYPEVFPPGYNCPNITLWQLMIELLNDSQESNLEVIVMTTIRALVNGAHDKEEMKSVLTSGALHPRLLQQLFKLYMKKNPSIQINIKATLEVYLPLFEPELFDPNCHFLMNKMLSDINIAKPTEKHLFCIELLIMIGPHLTQSSIGMVSEFLAKFVNDPDNVSNQLQKRVYRFYELITSSNTETSNEYTKTNLKMILNQFHVWNKVTADSWKCRMKTLFNLFKLMNDSKEIGEFLNGFLSEIISCLNMVNKKTRAVAGLLLVEAIIASGKQTEDEEKTLSESIDRMLQKIILCLQEKFNDDSKQAVQFKSALSKALFLILSENRLSRSVTRKHITEAMAIIKHILSSHNSSNSDRHLVYCALDILAGIIKRKTCNFNQIYLVDVGECITSADNALRMKVRQPIKKILKKMLNLWDYEKIKKVIPQELIPVLRNIHKSMNRSNRKNKDSNDNESFATSWGGISETGSSKTMKNPHIRNIADLLHDTDSEDDDLKTKLTTTTIGNKSMKSNKSMASKANELRKARKRKMDSANATLHLEERLDDIVDLSDPTSLVRHLRISDKKDKPTEEPRKIISTVDKRGFQIKDGRIIIGKTEDIKEVNNTKNNEDDDSENEHYKSEKERFQPVKKRVRRDKMPGNEYKSTKKGVFGDMKRKDKPDPYAYIPFKSTDQCHSVMTKYEKEVKKAQKAARQMSKSRKH